MCVVNYLMGSDITWVAVSMLLTEWVMSLKGASLTYVDTVCENEIIA